MKQNQGKKERKSYISLKLTRFGQMSALTQGAMMGMYTDAMGLMTPMMV